MVVAGPGDFDGDGQADLLVTSQYQTSAWVIHPPGAGTTLTGADPLVEVYVAFGAYGLAWAGDILGDGTDAIVVSSISSGVTSVYAGGHTGALSTPDALAVWDTPTVSDSLGRVVAGLGDIDGDGVADIGVSAQFWGDHDEGAIYIESGAALSSGPIADADAVITGTPDRGYVGLAFSEAGDTNGDGYNDIVAGCHQCGAWLIFGPPVSGEIEAVANATLRGSPSTILGDSVAGGGDVNGDGRDDLLIGDPQLYFESRSTVGAAWLVLSPVEGVVDMAVEAAALIHGDGAEDQAAFSMTLHADINGDGLADPVLGAPYNDAGGAEAGAVYALFGGAD